MVFYPELSKKLRKQRLANIGEHTKRHPEEKEGNKRAAFRGRQRRYIADPTLSCLKEEQGGHQKSEGGKPDLQQLLNGGIHRPVIGFQL